MQTFNRGTKGPILAHCDFCPSEDDWCIALNCGESNTRVLVCDECQRRMVALAGKGIEMRRSLRLTPKARSNGNLAMRIVSGRLSCRFLKTIRDWISFYHKLPLLGHHYSQKLKMARKGFSAVKAPR